MKQNLNYLKKNLSDIVIDYIMKKIFTGEYREGDRLFESKIAEELNISRSPVREGIIELQNQGLVKYIPRKGNFITKMTMEDIKEIFDIRLLLENDIIEILINEKKLTEADFAKLTQIVDEMVDIATSDLSVSEKVLGINEKDIEFHTYIWNKSESKRRVKILTDLFYQLKLAMIIDTEITGDLITTSTDHYDIIKYLRSGDIEKCKEALKSHIITYSKKGVRKNYLAQVK